MLVDMDVVCRTRLKDKVRVTRVKEMSMKS